MEGNDGHESCSAGTRFHKR
jgi:ATP-binding protein involved in chromosome partitioning